MKKFFPVLSRDKASSSTTDIAPNSTNEGVKVVDYKLLETDPGIRPPISSYHPDIQDEVRKAYLKIRRHQPPSNFVYPWSDFRGTRRRFNKNWFNLYDWLEYSESKNLAFCLPCFLFKNVSNYGGDHFVGDGFGDWKNPRKLANHATSNNSHVDCVHMGYALMNPNQSIKAAFVNQTKQMNVEYCVRVKTSLLATKYLLRCGLAFRGSDEADDSLYKGPFLELLDTLKENNSDVATILDSAPGNSLMTCPKIQKDLASACACEITREIVCDIADDVFCVLIDESGDVSGREQMAVVLRYVDGDGLVKERFLGITSVKETSAKSLKDALETMLSINGLSFSSIRGQGYDGASNMRGRFGGLKTLIQNENPSAHYVHCFAHQLQLALVACAKTHKPVSGFFGKVNMLVNFIRASNKRQEMLRDKQLAQFAKLIEEGEIETGSGLNQDSSIARAGDTRWGSHFRTLTSLMTLYGAIVEVIVEVGNDPSFDKFGETVLLLDVLQSFDFIFMLYMMVEILGITNDLSLALQRRDQDLLNAISLVNDTKKQLQEMRNEGWEELISRVVTICTKHEIDVPDMDAPYMEGKKPRRVPPVSSVSNLHHYKNDCLFSVLDLQLQELNARFDEENTELLQCVSCLSPAKSFSAFDVNKLLRMAELYPNDFVDVSEVELRRQLHNYVRNVKSDPKFAKLKGLSDLCAILVETNKCKTFALVFKLLKLALLLPVATASVERVFSAMKIVKSHLRNKMGDQWLNDRLVTFIERDVLFTISTDVILAHFQQMDDRRFSL
ncbi:zinc finger MYM-type protein 1-like [Medicago truncatula]|uniref:zinc finger MYM-type protein 1-like n=1 Tax=Medicago truncatula TaxID=3880 RepID=UPI0019671771|nr:zinc finger MYM-type protein 1-like [Medicago truncatula]